MSPTRSVIGLRLPPPELNCPDVIISQAFPLKKKRQALLAQYLRQTGYLFSVSRLTHVILITNTEDRYHGLPVLERLFENRLLELREH